MLYNFFIYCKTILRILSTLGQKKIYVLCNPIHPNLGDQAQLMCTDLWLKENYPEYKIIHLGKLNDTLNFGSLKRQCLNSATSLIILFILKITHRNDDIFIGHSGYLFTDHHVGYKTFIDMMHYFPKNKMIILPQTINFYSPFIKQYVKKEFLKSKNTTLLCRDEVSYKNALELFPTTKLLLFPDIVTSLIGTKFYNNTREGILFCMRDDLESFYKREDIDNLMKRFSNYRVDLIDTTLHNVSLYKINKYREAYINKTIEKISTFKVVITDRYHGTIFSVIASTPVIVISSTDHKLSSGVKWFPKDIFNGKW